MPIEVNPLTSPAPGTAAPGDLYVDLASRQIWLGVDPSVDPAQAVLVSDMLALDAAIDQAEANANAYTDTKIATRAPTVHTHVAADITDFNAKVDARIAASPDTGVPLGAIFMFSGSAADIGTGIWANYHVCDGTLVHVTPPLPAAPYDIRCPDLRDKFVIATGTWPINATNVSPVPTGATAAAGTQQSLVTGDAGAHTPVINAMSLAIGHLPSHTHGPGTLQGSDSFSGTTSANGTHNHIAGDAILGGSAGGSGMRAWTNTGQPTGFTDTEPNHTHTFSGSVTVKMTSGATAAAGSGTAHTHTAQAVADHHHSISGSTLRITLPFYALAFVMKVS